MDFRTIQIDRVTFDSPNRSRATWKSGVWYGSEKRIVFQTPPFQASVVQHKFLPDALTLQKTSTVHDLEPFSAFIGQLVEVFDAIIGYDQQPGHTHHLDFLTIGADAVVHGETDELRQGDLCRVACMVALTGGWCKPDDEGRVLSRGLTFEVDEIKVYDLVRPKTGASVFIEGKSVS